MLAQLISTKNKIPEDWIPMDEMDYRGQHIKFYSDADQVFTEYAGKFYEFGKLNTGYRSDMQLVIDDSLDTISRFDFDSRVYGAKLAWFQNAGYDDVKLTYHGRLIRVYLEPMADENAMISDAYNCICYNVLKITPKQDVFKTV